MPLNAKYLTLTTSTSWTRLHTLSLTNLYCWFIIDSCSTHSFFDLSCHGQECLFNIWSILCWCFQEWNSKTICKFLGMSELIRPLIQTHLCNSIFNNFLIWHITLVSYQKFVYTFCCISINLLKPLFDIVERVHIGNIVNNTDSVCATIIWWCDCSESFLTGCIPLYLVRLVLSICWAWHTIWSFTVFPSSSIVLIFYHC